MQTETTDYYYDCPVHNVSLGMCCGKGKVTGSWITERKEGEEE